MRIEVSYYQNMGTEEKKDWVKLTKIFYDEKQFLDFIIEDKHWKYSLDVNRNAK